VRNHLHGFAEVIAAPFLFQHGLVHAAAGEVVELGQLRMGEPLVMTEVQIGFRAVIQHVDFAVLKRAHRAGIHIEIRIELLQRHLETARLKQRTEGGSRQSLAEGTYYAACQKNIFHLLSNASTRCTSSGTSTPMASYSTGRTAISMPFSSARNCSNRSACSSGEGGNSTNRRSASHRYP